ncbi:MAG: chloride channel protein [Planctomycetes bacterium]|nr:chloride channel protein [Planctomycetota bacterium]
MSFFHKFFDRFSLADNKRLYIYSFFVGIASGLTAVLFETLLNISQGFLFVEWGNQPVSHPDGERSAQVIHNMFHFAADGDPIKWYLILLPAVGGLLSGWITYRFAPEAAGTGTDAMIDAFHNKVGKINAVVPLVKGLTTIITIASGGSTGKEGPVAQIGAGVGSNLATKMGIGVRARRTLLLAGTAAGLGAIFQAPLGGALTAVEVLYHEDIESDALIPCVISSITAYALFGSIFGFSNVFYLPEAHSIRFIPVELILFLMVGLVCTGMGFLYTKSFYSLRDKFFNPLPVPMYVKPAIGGLLVGITGFFYIEVMGSGFGYIQELIKTNHSEITWNVVSIFFILALLKIFATGFTISSGGSGGVFAPSLFIGSTIGAAVGGAAYLLCPSLVYSPFGAYVLVGMSAFFAGVAHAPIAAVIMMTELTGGYELLAPLMLVSVLVIIMSQKWSIYENQVHNKFFSKAHLGDMTIDVLQDLKVSVMGPYRQVGITSSHTLFHAGEAFGQKIHASDLVLVDHDDIFAGMVSLRDVHFDSSDPLIANLVTLEDIMTPTVDALTPDHNLHEALEILMSSEFDKVPIVASLEDEERHLLGYVLYNDILKKYHEVVNPDKVV